MNPGKTLALVGGQFGSEGKGNIATYLAKNYAVHVRVGAANAGHTFYIDRKKIILRQLPVAAYANPEAKLVIGPGALLSPQILFQEISDAIAWRERRGFSYPEIHVDYRAHTVLPEHITIENTWGLKELISSTSARAQEGIGAAQAAKIQRSAKYVRMEDWVEIFGDKTIDDLIIVDDTVELLSWAKRNGQNILLEGTQGTGLSLTTGFYPFVTSRDVSASGLAADCGLGPHDIDEILLVLRTFPIRVAENSGPFYADSRETSFAKIGVEPEKTTVTDLERRVATFSIAQAQAAAKINSADKIALMFADYIDPSIAGQQDPEFDLAELSLYPEVHDFVARLEEAVKVPVAFLGTGPKSIISIPPLINK